MRISLNWMTDYLDLKMPAAELADLLMRIGLPVESIDETDTDIVLDVEVTSNRGDLLGHIGMAREISAATGLALKLPQVGALPTQGSAKDLSSVQVLAPELCPRYTARIIRGVKIGKSPRWMVERLEAVGLRSINNVVDVTNYILMEYSQPLHSFDFDKLDGGRIVVRRAQDGETLVSIDGTTCRLDSQMLVIADARKPVAIAGVMGGLNTEVGDATVNVLIESAQFDPLSIRRTSRKLALMSESNYRFERGVDAAGADAASLKACQMILEFAGGRLAEGILDAWAAPHVPATVELRPQRTQAILGLEIPRSRQVELLARLNLSPREQDGKIVCTIPSYRRDLSREIDLIEEIARLHGYDKIPVSSQVRHSVTPPGRIETLRRQVGSVLTACGFDEAITFTFVDAAEAALFGCEKPVQVDPLVRKSNNALRPTVLPSLMRCCKTNQDAGNGGANLFELSAVFRPGASGLPEEHTELAMAGTRDLRELRGTMEELAATVAPKAKITFVPAGVPGLASDAAAEILLDGKACGSVGMIAKNVLDHYGLEHEIAAGTIRFDALLALAGAARKYEPLPRFPSVRRDVSLIVDEGLTWRQLSECIEGVEQELRAGYEYVTTYRGKPIESGKKSVTITLVYRSASGTLRSEQVDEQVSQVIAAAKEKFAADVRI